MDVDRNSRAVKGLEQSTPEERTPLNDDSDYENHITEGTSLTITMTAEQDADATSHNGSEPAIIKPSLTATTAEEPEEINDSGIVEDRELVERPVVCTDDRVQTNDTEETDPQTDQCVVIISEDSISTMSSSQGDMCRICHCMDGDEVLISPCECNGSMKHVHQSCLQKWVKSSDTKKCELCGFEYNMTSSVKPFRKWSKLNMTSVERRKVLCSVTFHVVAITCVIWSLYVLIERTTTEIQEGNLNWPFWTKLVVVAIGFTGGVVFMYVQCKMYVQLFKKWKQFNRVIYINNVCESETENDSDSKTNNRTVIFDAEPSNVEENKIAVVNGGQSLRKGD